jgi:DNA repair protein RecO (recombination protein O)
VSDFDVRSWRPGIRDLYERSAAASAMAETILAGHGGGGSWAEALSLAEKTLDALESADEGTCLRILIHFLWNWVDLLGLRPELTRCASCGGSFAANSACEAPADGVLWYSGGEGLLCASCARGRGEGVFLPLSPGARRWLAAVQDQDPSALTRLSLDGASVREAKALSTGILAEAFGKRLGSWDF